MLLPKQITALARIVARGALEAGRFALSTVRIERHEGGPRAMATDGRRAVVFTWDEPDPKLFPAVQGLSPQPVRRYAANVPPKALVDAGRGVPSGKGRGTGGTGGTGRGTPNPALRHLLLDETDASDVRVAAASNGSVTRSRAQAREAQFPDCQSVLPAAAREGNVYEPRRHGVAAFTHTRIGVNARQMAETLRVVADLAAEDPHHTVVMTVPLDPRRPLRLDARCPGRRAAAAVMPVFADFPSYDENGEPQKPGEPKRTAAAALPAPGSAPTEPAPSSPVRKPGRPRRPRLPGKTPTEPAAVARAEEPGPP